MNIHTHNFFSFDNQDQIINKSVLFSALPFSFAVSILHESYWRSIEKQKYKETKKLNLIKNKE